MENQENNSGQYRLMPKFIEELLEIFKSGSIEENSNTLQVLTLDIGFEMLTQTLQSEDCELVTVILNAIESAKWKLIGELKISVILGKTEEFLRERTFMEKTILRGTIRKSNLYQVAEKEELIGFLEESLYKDVLRAMYSSLDKCLFQKLYSQGENSLDTTLLCDMFSQWYESMSGLYKQYSDLLTKLEDQDKKEDISDKPLKLKYENK